MALDSSTGYLGAFEKKAKVKSKVYWGVLTITETAGNLILFPLQVFLYALFLNRGFISGDRVSHSRSNSIR